MQSNSLNRKYNACKNMEHVGQNSMQLYSVNPNYNACNNMEFVHKNALVNHVIIACNNLVVVGDSTLVHSTGYSVASNQQEAVRVSIADLQQWKSK